MELQASIARLGHRNSRNRYHLQGTSIAQVCEEKDLGVIGGNDSFYPKPKIQEKMHETCQIVTKLEGEIINFLILLDSLTETDEK